MRGVVIAGTHSGCGKTTITLGLMAALRGQGLRVQPFKAGPDFIDTGLHRLCAGRASRNLDLWMCGTDYVKDCYLRHSSGADISIVEGVMGLYDGNNSTYNLASVLGLPIVIVVDVYGMAESAGAVVRGFMEYDKERLIKGVIFNRVGSERHLDRIRRESFGLEFVGSMPREGDFTIPSRHLGLVVAEENPLCDDSVKSLANTVSTHMDMETFLGISGGPRTLSSSSDYNTVAPTDWQSKKVAIAYDRAFCFYYEDNIDMLNALGAQITRFSPLEDKSLPLADLIYIGGGYPELYAERLSENKNMLDSIREWSNSGMPLYAECGGMMYLSKGIYDLQDRYFQMVGIFQFTTKMNSRLSRLGYREIEFKQDCLLGKKGLRFRGHEFHYSNILDKTGLDNIYLAKDNDGRTVDALGFGFKKTLCSYVHLHFGSNREAVGNISRCL